MNSSWVEHAGPLGSAISELATLLGGKAAAGSPVQAHFAPSQKAGSLLFRAKPDKYIVKTQAVAFGLQLGAWQRFLPDEVRGEAKDAAGLQLETSFHGHLARL